MTLACRELDLDAKHHPPRAMLAQVSNLKNELIDHETFAARAEGYRERALAEAYGEYQRRLVAAGAMDFDDLIMNTVFLLQAFPDVAQAGGAGSGTCWWTSTKTPITRSTYWCAGTGHHRAGQRPAPRGTRRRG